MSLQDNDYVVIKQLSSQVYFMVIYSCIKMPSHHYPCHLHAIHLYSTK
jgi:hypothetical protein